MAVGGKYDDMMGKGEGDPLTKKTREKANKAAEAVGTGGAKKAVDAIRENARKKKELLDSL
jgi:hypothetical protein